MRLRRRYKRLLRALRRPFEWVGVFLGYLVLSNLPRRAMLAVCDLVAGIMYLLDRRGRALALANLRVIYGRDVIGAEKIVRRSYRNMARTGGHAVWTCRNAKSRAAAAGEMCEEGKLFLAANGRKGHRYKRHNTSSYEGAAFDRAGDCPCRRRFPPSDAGA